MTSAHTSVSQPFCSLPSPLGSFSDIFFDHPLHEILIPQVYCVSVYILYTYPDFTHNIKISLFPKNQFLLPLRMHGLCIDKMVAGWKGLYLELCSHCQNLEKSITSWILVSYFKSSKNLTS